MENNLTASETTDQATPMTMPAAIPCMVICSILPYGITQCPWVLAYQCLTIIRRSSPLCPLGLEGSGGQQII
ncbi:hypothetical protein ASPWEDRAFT_44368 [Aspergillus wentii DTO 134E9]|uniref:Uncharacterized protein n=1 Tax=Aspergillus wentii DTO 134E9 TaxID=1073089 RepID=A0A1L9RBH6_ASPWE|nr:uncharacterized protein ASPWEDRAFT_44368 [Aspergillus wentii DTO 134E9]OJJ32274.1 hypothetical protein ASPWEDRAFT_44368 [Aspergillus wentii DTO 134E9]